MATVLVDSNILIDLRQPESAWNPWSVTSLAQAADRARLVINPIIYAEISVSHAQMEHLDAALPNIIEREDLPYQAAFLAGKVYLQYRHRAGTKTSPLPDFLIGAHAAVMGYELLTRDPRRYRTYFPTLTLIAP